MTVCLLTCLFVSAHYFSSNYLTSLATYEEYPVDAIGMEGSFERRAKAEGNLGKNMGKLRVGKSTTTFYG